MAQAAEKARSRLNTSDWVTLRRACDVLGVDESTLRRWADAGRLRVYRTPGGHRRFSLSNLQEMVAGDGRHRSADEMERLTVTKIRRQLQRARQHGDSWYTNLSEANRQELRELGRRLVEIVGEYLDERSHRGALLDEALEIGGAYGRVLIDAALPLPSAVGAYIGFRKTMDETTRTAASRESLPTDEALEACGQVHVLGDEVLLGIAAAYEAASSGSGDDRER
ncbi:MAG: helix-turn-helix domain-containing protein [Dehalococcoidia bacterium]|nr:helix-turn-helix domain-containing protein [Dehalococcoidia bacterium]